MTGWPGRCLSGPKLQPIATPPPYIDIGTLHFPGLKKILQIPKRNDLKTLGWAQCIWLSKVSMACPCHVATVIYPIDCSHISVCFWCGPAASCNKIPVDSARANLFMGARGQMHHLCMLHSRVRYSVLERRGFRNTQEFFAVLYRGARFIEVMHVS